MDTSEYKGKKLTSKEQQELRELTKTKNNLEFNMVKVVEECNEVNELLVKYITKRDGQKPTTAQIAEELGDLLFRMMILTDHLDIENEVTARAEEKMIMIHEHLKEHGGTKLVIER